LGIYSINAPVEESSTQEDAEEGDSREEDIEDLEEEEDTRGDRMTIGTDGEMKTTIRERW
jgi:hypothetical protein